jgi:uncharacterized Ntn-hydrolase superfamily protein
MKRQHLLFAFLAFHLWAMGQDTFSIVAVDTTTGEIGSAGASCLDNNSFPGSGGAIIISDIIPGRGAIHTQSFWNATNQNNARQKMLEGLAPTEILTWLKQNDAQGAISSLTRQYGIVDFSPQGQPRTAAYTGSQCYAWKGHKLGLVYAIQGNILAGADILDSMEVRFLAAEGTLADRLMAALQGANVPGADSRCLQNGTSSLSAFLRVAQPNDDADSLTLDLNVPSLPTGQEPIDSLQTLYNAWKASVHTTETPAYAKDIAKLIPNPAQGSFSLVFESSEGIMEVWNSAGERVLYEKIHAGVNTFAPTMPSGIYFVNIVMQQRVVQTQRLIWQSF